VLPEAPPTPDRLNDFGILKLSDHLSEVNHRNIVYFMIDFFCNFQLLPWWILMETVTLVRQLGACTNISYIILFWLFYYFSGKSFLYSTTWGNAGIQGVSGIPFRASQGEEKLYAHFPIFGDHSLAPFILFPHGLLLNCWTTICTANFIWTTRKGVKAIYLTLIALQFSLMFNFELLFWHWMASMARGRFLAIFTCLVLAIFFIRELFAF